MSAIVRRRPLDVVPSLQRLLVVRSMLMLLLATTRKSAITTTASAFVITTTRRATFPKTVGPEAHNIIHSLSGTRRRFSTSTRTIMATTTTTTISFDNDVDSLSSTSFDTTVFIGKKETLQTILSKESTLALILGQPSQEKDEEATTTATTMFTSQMISSMLETVKPKLAVTSFLPGRGPERLSIGVLPDKVSRNNHPLSVHTLTELVASTCSNNSNNSNATRVFLCGASSSEAASPPILAAAAAKAFPLYSRKTNGNDGDKDNGDTNTKTKNVVHISFLNNDGDLIQDQNLLEAAQVVTDSVRLAGRLVDMTPEELTTTAYADEVKALVKEHGNGMVQMQEIVGEELRDKGYGGIWGVGKQATCPPRLVVLDYNPLAVAGADTKRVALVGKGIVYDTGGLSLKPKEGMCGMKGDMGGSAGLLGAFFAAVRLQVPKKITLLLCLAENAIGPLAFRNDDILTMYSGKTVENNNADAEGRLVLGDGVAHATKHYAEDLDLVVDMATLTGAQLVTTGKKHASVLANTAELEQKALQAGLRSGDLCYPILYAPELLFSEFESKVADMKNSVKDRSNAQASCAGHFIEKHLAKDYEGGWVHIDMAGPSSRAERGTGYGVALILSLLEAPGF